MIIAGWSFFLSTLLLVAFYIIKPGLNLDIDSLVVLIWLTLSGVLITRQARKYDVEKSGWLGVGGKAILSVLAVSWVFVGVYLVVHFWA